MEPKSTRGVVQGAKVQGTRCCARCYAWCEVSSAVPGPPVDACGMRDADVGAMGVKHHRELVVWQLANELRRAIVEITARPLLGEDLKFRQQIRNSCSSVCSNIAEGFQRFYHREFARYISIARGSLGETQEHLEEALQRRYINQREFQQLWKGLQSNRCASVDSDQEAGILPPIHRQAPWAAAA